jgi:hypothetical protein
MSLRAGVQEEDKIPVGTLAMSGLIIAVIMVITYLVVLDYSKNDSVARREHDVTEQPKPGEAPQFGMLHQTLFNTVSDARELAKVQRAQLDSYGWVDKNAGVAHIPIENAKKMVAEGKR